MASQNRPASNEQAPDPATSYERAKPEKEAGMGDLKNNKATPNNQPDGGQQAVPNSHPPRQINAEDNVNQRADADANRMRAPERVDHSMHEEEPLGWDQAPQGKMRPEDKRHPRTGGKGGTP
jgi:hypothetical protein